MVPLLSSCTVNGIPVSQLMPKNQLNKIVQRTKDGGAEIVKMLKTGSAFYAPGASITQMVESILKDKKMILPCAVYCGKEYGVGGYFIGVPAKLGRKGVEGIIELKLSAEEKNAFKKSVEHTKELVKSAEKFL